MESKEVKKRGRKSKKAEVKTEELVISNNESAINTSDKQEKIEVENKVVDDNKMKFSEDAVMYCINLYKLGWDENRIMLLLFSSGTCCKFRGCGCVEKKCLAAYNFEETCEKAGLYKKEGASAAFIPQNNNNNIINAQEKSLDVHNDIVARNQQVSLKKSAPQYNRPMPNRPMNHQKQMSVPITDRGMNGPMVINSDAQDLPKGGMEEMIGIKTNQSIASSHGRTIDSVSLKELNINHPSADTIKTPIIENKEELPSNFLGAPAGNKDPNVGNILGNINNNLKALGYRKPREEQKNRYTTGQPVTQQYKVDVPGEQNNKPLSKAQEIINKRIQRNSK